MSTESVMPSNHLSCCPLLLLPSIFPRIRVFSNELALHIRWPKYWHFSISPSSEYSGVMFFRIDWFDLHAVWGILKIESSPAPQFESISSSVISLFYGPTITSVHGYWKNHIFDYRTFVSKVVSLLLNTLSRFVIAFLSRSRHLLILWLHSPSAVTLESKKIKSVTAAFSPSVCCEMMGLGAMILVFWMFKPAFSLFFHHHQEAL